MAITNGEKARLPLLVFHATPIAGHTLPLIHLASILIRRGYEAIFMTSTEFAPNVDAIGASFWECGPAFLPGVQEAREQVPIGIARMVYDCEHFFLASLPARTASMRALLEAARERHGRDRRVVVVNEMMSMGVLAFHHGAPPPAGWDAFPPAITINVLPLICSSEDTAPFGPALPPDATPSGRARNRLLNALMFGPGSPFAGLSDVMLGHLRRLGCPEGRLPTGNLFDALTLGADAVFQMCTPSMDYPRADLPLKIRYAGALPPRKYEGASLPAAIADLLADASNAEIQRKKKVVMVTQGTINLDYSELIAPTLAALADNDNVRVIAVLGVRGASLTLTPDGKKDNDKDNDDASPPKPVAVPVPANAVVVDYVPYELVLPHVDALVCNAGFGAFVHAAVHGVPMVAAGEAEDKAEVAARAEHAGMAVNLRTQRPAAAAVAAAVDEVLGLGSGSGAEGAEGAEEHEQRYGLRARRLRQDNIDLDAVHMIERQILEYAGVEQ
ncbi:hypothetical protein GGR56DRAFT_118409 [Xylariaceae sp. FL0804]|nr:hypothetical protein GGR56DRAFT_118409 [Xylariaceae sp. FL0804]